MTWPNNNYYKARECPSSIKWRGHSDRSIIIIIIYYCIIYAGGQPSHAQGTRIMHAHTVCLTSLVGFAQACPQLHWSHLIAQARPQLHRSHLIAQARPQIHRSRSISQACPYDKFSITLTRRIIIIWQHTSIHVRKIGHSLHSWLLVEKVFYVLWVESSRDESEGDQDEGDEVCRHQEIGRWVGDIDEGLGEGGRGRKKGREGKRGRYCWATCSMIATTHHDCIITCTMLNVYIDVKCPHPVCNKANIPVTCL